MNETIEKKLRNALTWARAVGLTITRGDYGVRHDKGVWVPNVPPGETLRATDALGALLMSSGRDAPYSYQPGQDPAARAVMQVLGVDNTWLIAFEAGWDGLGKGEGDGFAVDAYLLGEALAKEWVAKTPPPGTLDVVSAAKEKARIESQRACRAMESAVQAALGETGRIYGLPNIGIGNCRYTGVRVRSDIFDAKLPRPDHGAQIGKPTLVLDGKGRLLVAWVIADPDGVPVDVGTRPARDAELIAEDAGRLASLLAEVIAKHVEAAQAAREKFEKMEALAQRLSLASTTPCLVYDESCPTHGFYHGAEAEELREGIEKIISDVTIGDFGATLVDVVHEYRNLLRACLDKVDARDSLAYLEARDRKRAGA